MGLKLSLRGPQGVPGTPGTSAHKAAVTIGDGVAKVFTITHNWNTKDVGCTFWDMIAGIRADGDPASVAATLNTIVVTFKKAPSAGQYRVVIWG